MLTEQETTTDDDDKMKQRRLRLPSTNCLILGEQENRKIVINITSFEPFVTQIYYLC